MHPLAYCAALDVQRGNDQCLPTQLEPGVKFFVLALEALGAEPLWSCEGHPKGFYVCFNGSLQLAEAIEALGFFTVELGKRRRADTLNWTLRLNDHIAGYRLTPKSHADRLRWAAEAWVKGLKLDVQTFPARSCIRYGRGAPLSMNGVPVLMADD